MVGNSANSNEWMVDVGDGKTAGPYSTQQILDFVSEGRLHPQHRITAPNLAGQWISVADFTAGSTNMGGSFQPPPKPAIQESSFNPDELGTDPSIPLFDALQAAKDRKAVHKPIYSPAIQSQPGFLSRVPAAAWIGGGGALAVTLIAWGLISTFKDQGEKIAQMDAPVASKVQAKPALQAPVTMVAKPVVAPVAVKSLTVPSGARPVAISPFGKIPQAKPLAAPIVRSPANEPDPRDAVDPYEQERLQREREDAEREREYNRSLGREPDSAISGTLAPAPDGGHVPENKEAAGDNPDSDRRID